MEALQLNQSIAIEINLSVALYRGVEHIVTYLGSYRTNTIDTTNTLHQTSRIPRGIVVDDNIRAMEIDTFGQDI